MGKYPNIIVHTPPAINPATNQHVQAKAKNISLFSILINNPNPIVPNQQIIMLKYNNLFFPNFPINFPKIKPDIKVPRAKLDIINPIWLSDNPFFNAILGKNAYGREKFA